MKFYADEAGDIVISLQDNAATVYMTNKDKILQTSEFVRMVSNDVLSEYPLLLEEYKEEIGNTYHCNMIKNICFDEISNNITDGYDVLSEVFSHSINEKNYNSWYTDISHRVRHGMSKIYTYNKVCSGTAYCNIDGMLLLAQLGTLQQARNQGLALKMIHHIANDQENVKTISLLSQDSISDKFYEKNNFQFENYWYYYTKD